MISWISTGQSRPGFRCPRKVDVRLPGKGDSYSHGARPIHSIITMIEWIRTSRLSIHNSLYKRMKAGHTGFDAFDGKPSSAFGVWGLGMRVQGLESRFRV